MNCANCGGIVKAGGKFCPHCGSAVAAAPPVEPAPTRLGAAEPAPPPTTRYCMTCGGAVGANEAKCDTCGAPLAAPVASGPRKTRLAAPIDASYEAVGSTPVQPPGAAAPGSGAPRPWAATPTRVQASPAIIKGSNHTFYQLLGLAFLLIACAYVGYHYWSAPAAPETRRAEGVEPVYGDLASSGEATPGSGAQGLGASGSVAQGSVAQGSGAVGYSQGQPGDEYQAQSAAGAGGQQAGLSEGQAPGTFGAASGAGVDLRGTAASGSVDRRAEALGTVPLSGEAGPSRSADPAATRRASRQPIDPRAPRIVTPPPPPRPPAAPLAVESRPPAKVTLPSARPREPVPVEPVTPKDPSSAGAGQAPPSQGDKVLLPGSQAWRVPSKKSAPADEPTQTAAASPPPRSEPRPVAPPPQVRTEGIIYWTGKLKKNQTIVIDGAEATVGFADGNLLPGSAVEVHIPSPAVQLVEYPTPRDGWKRVAFRCLRSTKRSVTLNIQWKLR